MNPDLQSAIDQLSDAIILLSRDGYINYTNLAASDLFGYEVSELFNQPLSIIYATNGDAFKEEYELRMARKNGKYSSSGWKYTKDGRNFWAETTINALYDNNTLTGFVCTVRDTSARKDEELRLRQSEEKYRLMVEKVKDYSIFLLNTTGHIATWNEGAQQMKGYNADEVIGKHFSIFYTDVDLKNNKPEKELEIAMDTGKYEEEGWRIRKNGTLFWASVVITALVNEHNKHIGFSKVTRDLTERKLHDESLRFSEERYRLLVEQVIDYGIFMLDEKGRVISWNEGARKIKGYEAEEIIGKYFSIFYPEEDIINAKPANELKIARSEGKFEEEGWRLRKDGSRFWANVVITAVYNNDGILIGFSKVTRDLTERKEAERLVRESFERYRTLAERLRITNDELSYANQELEQFTSIVSHDLQEPVRTIKSFLQLIDMNISDEENEILRSYISKSITAANRMKELIQNLLNYSQLSKGEMVEETVDTSEIINQAIQNLRSSIENSQAEVTVHNKAGTIYGDKIQLVQLIQNLISNSLKFTSADRPRIHIESGVEGGHVKFSVSDNGIGIAQGDLKKVFEIFRRLNTKKAYPGTGIGLAICKKIVERHNGRIWPQSTPGSGTTFHFTLNENIKERQVAS